MRKVTSWQVQETQGIWGTLRIEKFIWVLWMSLIATLILAFMSQGTFKNLTWKISTKQNKRAYMVKSYSCCSVQFSSLSCIWLFATPWTAAHQASLFITNSQSLLKLMSIESVMPSNHLILCRLLLLPPSIFPSIRVFSNESVLRIRWQSIEVLACCTYVN